jgi:mono/diheme cytochrome c family protein
MKKQIIFSFSIYLMVLFSFCTVQKKVEYEFPEAMLPHVKEAYKQQCDKGQILYNINCASCHTQKKGWKLILPTFQESQLKGYELRVANAKHESSLPDEKVSEEELGLIMTFLRYKKPSIK